MKIKHGIEVYGTVRTNIHGSAVEFYVCELEEWEGMTEEQRDKILFDMAFESGSVEIS